MNKAFEFDGTTYVQIRTGMTTDAPTHIRAPELPVPEFPGSVQFSALGAPYSWTAVLGAGEIATGDYVTGMIPSGGTNKGSAMGIFTSGKTYMLYGSSSADFQLVISTFDLGFLPSLPSQWQQHLRPDCSRRAEHDHDADLRRL